jgi:hypothetical protein
MFRLRSRAAAAAGLLLLVSGSGATVAAQEHHDGMAHRHMSLTALAPGTADDTARALDLVRRLRLAIEPYQTLEAAADAGYFARRDSATVRGERLLHVGKRLRDRAWRTFDPAVPQSLLYRRADDGSMRLAGAMFVAPRGATSEELDAMVPLSVAHWHRHVDVCVATGQGQRRVLRRVTTAEQCEAAGGRFRAETRYMIHVMIDAGDDLAGAFPQGRDG